MSGYEPSWTVPAGVRLTPGAVNGLTPEKQWAFRVNRKPPTWGLAEYATGPIEKINQWMGRMAMERTARRPQASVGPTPAVLEEAMQRAEQAYVGSFAWQDITRNADGAPLANYERACTCKHGISRHRAQHGRCRECSCKAYVPGGFHPETILDLEPDQRKGKPGRTLNYMSGSLRTRQGEDAVHYECTSREFALVLFHRRTDLPKESLFGSLPPTHPLETYTLARWTWRALMPILVKRRSPQGDSSLTTGTTYAMMHTSQHAPTRGRGRQKEASVTIEFKRKGRGGPLAAETPIGEVTIEPQGKGRKRTYRVLLAGAEVAHAAKAEDAQAAAADIIERRMKARGERPKGWGLVRTKEAPDPREGASGLMYLPAVYEGRELLGRFAVGKDLEAKRGWLLFEGNVTGETPAVVAEALVAEGKVIGSFASVNESLHEVGAIIAGEPAPIEADKPAAEAVIEPAAEPDDEQPEEAAEAAEPEGEPEPEAEGEGEPEEEPLVSDEEAADVETSDAEGDEEAVA
jgi:hypothetical protein